MVILTMMIMMMMLRVWVVFDLYFPHFDKKTIQNFPLHAEAYWRRVYISTLVRETHTNNEDGGDSVNYDRECS